MQNGMYNDSEGAPLDFGPTNEAQRIIKVVGVGGGGCNAVDYMYLHGIHDVSFLVCNTDSQVLSQSPVPVRLQLGKEGLGAGNNPKEGCAAAIESLDDIKKMLSDGTKMTFITAGMGGGTGTGAAPVIAKVSKEMGILTVGIVTIPFKLEGEKKIDMALDGVEELEKNVDALLVINNERLRPLYGDLDIMEAYAKTNEILNNAAKSIAEIITKRGVQNLDFKDVRMVLQNGGVAVMSTGYGEGEGRVRKAIEDALHSPLISDNDIFNSKKILFNITFASRNNSTGGLLLDEMTDINDFMERFKTDFEIKWGFGVEDGLGAKVKFTILATGFGLTDIDGMDEHIDKQHTAEERARQQQEEDKKRHNQTRRERYYHPEEQEGKIKRNYHIYKFSYNDLDNDDIIYAVETTPTATRSRQECKAIHGLSERKEQKPIAATNSDDTGQQLISFT